MVLNTSQVFDSLELKAKAFLRKQFQIAETG